MEKCVPDDISGFPVGWVPGFEYQSVKVQLEPGDTLVLFTDGILDAEAADGIRFGEDGVNKVLAAASNESLTAKSLGERIIAAVRAHAANHPQFDDIALVCYGRSEDSGLIVAAGEAEIELQ